MNYLIVYSSLYGSTLQIVNWIKQRLEIDKKNVVCLNVVDFEKREEKPYEVVLLATPLYSGKATNEFYHFLENGFQELIFKELIIVGVAMQKNACFDKNKQLKFLDNYKKIRNKAYIQEILLGELIFDNLNKKDKDKLFTFYKNMNLDEKQLKNMLSPKTFLNKKEVWEFTQKI